MESEPIYYVDAVRERLSLLEDRFQRSQDKLNGSLEKLRDAIEAQATSAREAIEVLKSDYAKRVPIWVGIMMKVTGLVIGAMAMWILNQVVR